MMRIGLLASDEVGAEIVGMFAERGVKPRLLGLDVRDVRGDNDRMAEVSGAEVVVKLGAVPGRGELEVMEKAQLDLVVLAWWPYLIRSPLLEYPKHGFLNFHPSLLPYNRGKHPNFWSLVEGNPYGVTLHFINAGVDTGDVAYQREIPVSWEDTGGTLHARARRAIVELFREHFEEIVEGRIPRRGQDAGKATFHRAKELDAASRIELNRAYSARELLNLIRARTYPPHPGAWFRDGDEEYEVRVEIRKRHR